MPQHQCHLTEAGIQAACFEQLAPCKILVDQQSASDVQSHAGAELVSASFTGHDSGDNIILE